MRRIDPDNVVTLAIEIIDRDGLEAVTMRRLATEISVTAMSLYRHFADKEALLREVCERIGREINARRAASPPPPSADVWDRLRARLRPPVEVLMGHHSDITQLLQARSLRGDQTPLSHEALDNHERTLELLDGLGITGHDAAQWVYLLRQSVFMLANACRGEEVAEPGGDGGDRRVADHWRGVRSAAPADHRRTAALDDSLSRSAPAPSPLLDEGIEMLVSGVRERARRHHQATSRPR